MSRRDYAYDQHMYIHLLYRISSIDTVRVVTYYSVLYWIFHFASRLLWFLSFHPLLMLLVQWCYCHLEMEVECCQAVAHVEQWWCSEAIQVSESVGIVWYSAWH